MQIAEVIRAIEHRKVELLFTLHRKSAANDDEFHITLTGLFSLS